MYNLSLLMVANECGHNFDNLKSYNRLFREIYIYDNGLSEDNIKSIKLNFRGKVILKKDHTKYFSFSDLRNKTLKEFNDKLSKYVLMIDDSYSVVVINDSIFRVLLMDDYDQIITKLTTSRGKSDICRIFKKSCRFEGVLNETIRPYDVDGNPNKIVKTYSIEIIDNYEDHKKSKERALEYLKKSDLSKVFRSDYHVAMYFDGCGMYPQAMYYYNLYYNSTEDSEIKGIILYRMYEITKNDIYLERLLAVSPERAFEVYYVKGDWESFMESYGNVYKKKNDLVYPVSPKYFTKYMEILGPLEKIKKN